MIYYLALLTIIYLLIGFLFMIIVKYMSDGDMPILMGIQFVTMYPIIIYLAINDHRTVNELP